MTPQFRLTEPAIRDIEQIADYIARESGLAQADRFLTRLDAKFAKIAQFPNLGRQRSEILPGLRSLPMDRYLILYIPANQDVDILRVVSGYRDLPALFADSDE
ncbi:type II toxin-antitoxin system RelE/ParE family toxin [Oscillatoria sp. FACHB-1406]|uniref:type II toxin-antitoxin system RelE/ParE family toxin n=1 Tax=Oscillatoria sp. FACHB-1406 TaxID=2692846 RepID=UPI001682193C|nr:type II toxin-antitoxin system RelE/ParE family toxin [Oscillatoria sp. FACHB-1406]MBD2580456.1 type II toxin-antitoxin system RelE/ParE family toxin [Oscillatoria sp. FACHB-1406]